MVSPGDVWIPVKPGMSLGLRQKLISGKVFEGRSNGTGKRIASEKAMSALNPREDYSPTRIEFKNE